MKWRNSKERELLSAGGSREDTLPSKDNPNPDLSDTQDEGDDCIMDQSDELLHQPHRPHQDGGHGDGSDGIFLGTTACRDTVLDHVMTHPNLSPSSHAHITSTVDSDSDEEINIS